MSKLSVVSLAVLAGLVAGAGTALAIENFVPYGHLYAPDSGPLPPLNSPRDKIDAQTDVYQTEIWKKQMERKLFDSNMDRFIDHDLSTPGWSDRPRY
jgi:hypothetical protein